MAIKVIFFDCDGTLTEVRSSWEYLHRRLGLWSDNADLYQRLFREKKIDYHEFCKRDALLWKGLSLDQLYTIIDEIPYHSGAAEMIRTLKKMGILTVIVSTGLSLLVERVREKLDIDWAIANDLLAEDRILDGDVRINVEYDKKGPVVRLILEELGFEKGEAAAVGDGHGDKGMFDEVALPISFNHDEENTGSDRQSLHATLLSEVVDIVRNYQGYV